MFLQAQIILNPGLTYIDFLIKVYTILYKNFLIDKIGCLLAAHELWHEYKTITGDPIVLNKSLNKILEAYKDRRFNVPKDLRFWCLSEHVPQLKVCKAFTRKQAIRKATKSILKKTKNYEDSITMSIMKVTANPLSKFDTLKTYEVTFEKVDEPICLTKVSSNGRCSFETTQFRTFIKKIE